MKENRIESFAALESALNDMTQLANEMSQTLNETNAIYESQNEGWASSNSAKEQNKMMDYANEGQKIVKNINTVSEAVQKFKTSTYNVDVQ